MFSYLCVVLFALAINFQHVKGLMVKSVDGSFVPLSFVARAPGDAIAVRMSNNDDVSYLAFVLMGTPAQQIEMAVSLSQNFISVASPPGGVNDPYDSYYNPAASTSYMPIDGAAAASLTTISGQTATGHFASEICTLQSSTFSPTFTYLASVVVADSSVTTDLFPPGARAILGYGVNTPSGSPPNASLIPTFLPSNFTTAVCGVELNHFHDHIFPDGILTMGAVDSTAFIGEFTNVMVPATSTISWSIPVDAITFLSNDTNLLTDVAGDLASIDMYHSTIQVRDEVARRIYSTTTGARPISATEWSIPCNASFVIKMTFAGVRFTMVERDTIVHTSDGTCVGVITGGATTIGKVGAPFMRTVYTQFGAAKTANGTTFSVGFAQKVQRQASPTTMPLPSQTTISTTSPTPSPSSSSTTTSNSGARATSSILGLAIVSIALVMILL